MPIDPVFTSKFDRKGYRRLIVPDSIEMQLGRSDFKLGELQTACHFPESDQKPSDASEWRRGWLSEKQIERAFQEENTPPPRKPWKPRA